MLRSYARRQRLLTMESLERRLVLTGAPLPGAPEPPTDAPVASLPACEIVESQERFDVTRDGVVTPIDSLAVINYLNDGAGQEAGPFCRDVNHDGGVSPVDALLVINYLVFNVGGDASSEELIAPPVEGPGDGLPDDGNGDEDDARDGLPDPEDGLDDSEDLGPNPGAGDDDGGGDFAAPLGFGDGWDPLLDDLLPDDLGA